MSTRAEQVAAALERLQKTIAHLKKYSDDDSAFIQLLGEADTLARLLREREANPPASLESSGEQENCVRCGNRTGKGTTPLSSVYYKGTGPLCGWCYDLMCNHNGDVSMPDPAVGEDEALLNVLDAIETKLASTEQYELAIGCQSVATRLRAALADLARAEARPSRYEDLMAIEQLQVQVDHYRTGMIESRAALADVARLAHALSDSARELKRVISERDAARAALAAAVQEKEKAVAEEREAIAAAIDKMAALAAIHYDETSQRAAAVLEDAAVEIRARAGRNDVG